MKSITPTTRDYLAVSVYWLAVAFFWGALLFVVMQARVQSLVEAEFPNGTKAFLESRIAQQLSWLIGAGALVAAVTQIVAGALSDASSSRRGKRKPFLIFGTLAASVGIAAFPFAQSYWQIFALFVWIQLFLNIATGPFHAIMPDTIPATHHGAASAWIGLWRLLGSTGGMVAGALLMRFSWGLSVLTVAFLVLLNGFMLLTVLLARETNTQQDTSRRAALAAIAPRALWEILRTEQPFAWLLLSRFFIMCGIYTMMPFLQYYLINVFGLSRDEAFKQQALLALIVNFTGALGTVPAGRAGDRMPKKNVVAVACAICVAGGLGFALSGKVGIAAISAGVFGLGYGAFQAIDWAFACNVLPKGKAGQSAGIWSLADTVPQFIAPVLGGLFASRAIASLGAANGYRAVMLLTVVWFLCGVALVFKVKEKQLESEASSA
ncbi:MAG TPA: MFS transporter [Abditibacteriaceae bacterium]|jgi:MFS family permease